MMKTSRWAVIKWAARASSEQGATSMTEVKEQYDYLDNIEEQFYWSVSQVHIFHEGNDISKFSLFQKIN